MLFCMVLNKNIDNPYYYEQSTISLNELYSCSLEAFIGMEVTIAQGVAVGAHVGAFRNVEF